MVGVMVILSSSVGKKLRNPTEARVSVRCSFLMGMVTTILLLSITPIAHTVQHSTNSMITQKHTFFTRNGFNLEWGTPYQITLKSTGKQRIVQNFPFQEHGNISLIRFCQANLEKLESMSYTFTDPTNPNNLGRYRISYYCDPVDPVNEVSTSSPEQQEILRLQREILEVAKHVVKKNGDDLVSISQRMGTVATKI